jgi:hypothetical protein
MAVVQLVVGVFAMFVGAWLIGWWAVGVLLVLFGVLAIADAVLKEDRDTDSKRVFHDDVLERWRRAR